MITSNRENNRETERQRDRETERQRGRETEKEAMERIVRVVVVGNANFLLCFFEIASKVLTV